MPPFKPTKFYPKPSSFAVSNSGEVLDFPNYSGVKKHVDSHLVISATSPITATGSNIGFDFSTNNTWTGDNTFSDAVDLKWQTQGLGNTLKFQYTGVDPPIDVFAINGLTYCEMDYGFLANADGNATFSQQGQDPIHLAPSGNTDSFASVFSDNGSLSSNVKRAGLFTCEFTGSSASAHKISGINAFAHVESNSNLTSTNTYGGATGGRYAVRQYGTGTISMASGISAIPIFSADGVISEWTSFRSEDWTTSSTQAITNSFGFKQERIAISSTATHGTHSAFSTVTPNMGSGATLGLWKGLNISNNAGFHGTGTVTNAYGIYIEDMTVGSTNYALFVDAGLSRFDGDGTNVFELPTDNTDPTGGGGAATGRIPIKIGGATKYLAYY